MKWIGIYARFETENRKQKTEKQKNRKQKNRKQKRGRVGKAGKIEQKSPMI
jgi:hypothetical protein